MIQFDEQKHEYKIDGRVVPSVTQIISETIGCGWKAEQWYLDRGKAIHKCAELICKGKEFTCDERLNGYIAALKKFFTETKAEIIKSEFVVGSLVHQYAGTLDLICKIGSRRVLIDWKSSVDAVRIKLQCGGYAAAFVETFGIGCPLGAGVQIKDNGTYSMTELFSLEIPSREFLALRTCYRLKEKCGSLNKNKEV